MFLSGFLSGCVRERHAMSPSSQVLTQDVPADALALGRNRQVTKKDWAKRLHGLKSLRAKR
jgi:bifunctional N-acetylglucosamine-1-phosphate-uridyltransferase/glucosamine-1-phosphate-acetyltransferase GlmU-like protein